MSTTIIENLFAPGAVPSGDYIRIVGGIDPANLARPLAVDALGNLNIKPSLNSQTLYNQFRVATLENVYDVRQQFAKDTLYMVESLVGAATSTFLPNEAAVRLRVTAAAGDSAIRQTKAYIPYQIGRSQLIFAQAVMGAIKANVRQRIGYFDINDGVFFEQNGVNLRVVRRSFTSGAAVDTAVNQSAWNLDKLDGTGPSGVILNTSKFQVFTISLSWGGEVRFGFAIGGQIINCHQFDNSNIDTTIWASKASLPVRHEITNLAATAGNTDLLQFVLSVFSEGSIDQLGLLTAADNSLTTRALAGGTSLPVLSIRLKAAFARGIIIPQSVSVSQTTQRDLLYRLVVGGALTGAVFVAQSPATELDVSATVLTGGTVIQAGYIAAGAGSGGGGILALGSKTSLWASSDFAGTPDNLTILVSNPDVPAANVFSALQWKEIA